MSGASNSLFTDAATDSVEVDSVGVATVATAVEVGSAFKVAMATCSSMGSALAVAMAHMRNTMH